MKLLSTFFGIVFMYFLLFASIFPMSGCKKTEIEHDTVVHTIHDTTIHNIHDSTYTTDSVRDLTNGLVAYYNFNGGNLNDSSNFNNDIIFNNATPTADRFGNPNNAYLFNGANSYMRVQNANSLNPDNITVFVVLEVNGFLNMQCDINSVVDKGTPDDIYGFYAVRLEDHFPCDGVTDSTHEFFDGVFGDNVPQGSAAETAADTINVQKDQWYKIAFTYDRITAKTYINGVLVDARKKSINLTDNLHDLFIGRHESDQYPYWFNGVIDEIRIYNRALPPSTLQLLNNLTN